MLTKGHWRDLSFVLRTQLANGKRVCPHVSANRPRARITFCHSKFTCRCLTWFCLVVRYHTGHESHSNHQVSRCSTHRRIDSSACMQACTHTSAPELGTCCNCACPLMAVIWQGTNWLWLTMSSLQTDSSGARTPVVTLLTLSSWWICWRQAMISNAYV